MESLEQTFSKFQAEAERVGRAFSSGVIGDEEYEGRMLVLIERLRAQLIIGYGVGWTLAEEWPEEKEQTELDLEEDEYDPKHLRPTPEQVKYLREAGFELDLIEESKHILSKDN